MITRQIPIFFLFLWAVLMFSSPLPAAQHDESAIIEPKADKALRQMSDYMDSLQQFTIHIENSTDILLTSGHKIQLGDAVDVAVRRPNRLRGDMEGDESSQQFIYDGKSITLFDSNDNYFATAKAPTTIRDALELARESFGLEAPAADLISGNAYQVLTESVNAGFYLGLHRVLGIECHHLLFTQDEVDWQIWIENSKTPLPRKLIITEKLTAGGPQFTSLFSDWDLSPRLEEDRFTFTPPDTAKKIEFLPRETAFGMQTEKGVRP